MGDQSDWKTIGYGASRCVHNSGDRHWVGREAGTRENAHEVVINRNFPAGDFERDAEARWEPLSQPETRDVVDAVEEIGPRLIVALHSHKKEEFVNFDGPAQDVAERFSKASGMRIKTSQEIPSTPGSFGSYFGRDRGMPVLTIEFLRGSDPVQDWQMIRNAVLEAIKGPIGG